MNSQISTDNELLTNTVDTSDEDKAWIQNLSFKDFYADYCSIQTKKNIKFACIVLYATIGISLALYLLVLFSLLSGTIDTSTATYPSTIGYSLFYVLLLVITAMIHVRQNRFCAIFLLLYSVGTMIFSLITTGKAAGILVLIGALYACFYTFAAHAEFKDFKKE